MGLRAAEGQTINLTCKVFGSPKPLVVWKKGDEQLTGGRFRVMEDGNLEIAVSICLSALLCLLDDVLQFIALTKQTTCGLVASKT